MCVLWNNITCMRFFFPTDKKTKKKGKTMALTDFLSVDTPGSSSHSYAPKSVDWAAEMEDLDIGMIATFYNIHDLEIINGNPCRESVDIYLETSSKINNILLI